MRTRKSISLALSVSSSNFLSDCSLLASASVQKMVTILITSVADFLRLQPTTDLCEGRIHVAYVRYMLSSVIFDDRLGKKSVSVSNYLLLLLCQ